MFRKENWTKLLVSWALQSRFPWNYRGAALTMAVLVAIGVVPQIVKRKTSEKTSES